jgi:hypothetical protein
LQNCGASDSPSTSFLAKISLLWIFPNLQWQPNSGFGCDSFPSILLLVQSMVGKSLPSGLPITPQLLAPALTVPMFSDTTIQPNRSDPLDSMDRLDLLMKV